MDRIAPLQTQPIGAARSDTKPNGTPAGAFAEQLEHAFSEANRNLAEAEKNAEQMAAGTGDIVETMVALSRAELSLRHVTSIRNRVLEAYQEVLRLQL